MECSVLQCEPIAQFKQFNRFDYENFEIELLRKQLENIELQGLTGTDIKSHFHFHNNRACIERKCSEITSNQNKSIVLKIESKEEELPLPKLNQDTVDDLEDMFMSMSLKCDFSFTLKIAHPEFVTEKWLSVSILPTKPSLPKLLKDPYLAKVLSPTDQLNLPYNQSKWKYCFEEFYYCEYVSSNISDTKQFLKLYNSELEIHIEEVAPSIECSQCYKMIRPGRLIKHIFKHLLAQFPARDANKHLCLHCLSPNKKSFELLKHQVMIKNTVTRFCCMICNTCFVSDEKRLQHMQAKHTFNCMPYMCQICPYRCSTAIQIAHHISNTHPDSITCPFCLTVFHSEENQTIENTEKKFEELENICETVSFHLETHLINSHFFSCSQCQLTFNSEKELLQHKNIGHSDFECDTDAGYSVVPMTLSPEQKLVVQKYNKRKKLAVFVESELPIEEIDMKQIGVHKFKKRSHKNQDFLIDYPLLKHLLKEKFLFKIRAQKFMGENSLNFTKLAKTFKNNENSDVIQEFDFSNCYISDEIELVTPTNNNERTFCNECLEPLSKSSNEIYNHLNEEMIVCEFPDCFFKTMCFNAFQYHNHDDIGTRKTPLFLVRKEYLSLLPEKHLWICTNCAEYFTDFESLAHHVYEKAHVGFSTFFELTEISARVTNNLVLNCD